MENKALVEAALAAAQAAGAAARAAFLAAEQGSVISAEAKTGYADIVTAVDRKAEAIISAILLERVPHSRILGEEGGWQGAADATVTWYVDPIDGTSNFASGLPIFCVSIAAFAPDGTGLCGVVHDPMRDETFHAHDGRLLLNGRPVSPPSRARQDRDAELLSNLPREGRRPDAAELDSFAHLVERFRAVRRLGSSALHLAYVAVGRAAIGYDESCNPWDIAAGLLLVEAGGGQIAAWDRQGQTIATPQHHPEAIDRVVVTTPGYDLAGSAILGRGRDRLPVGKRA